MILSSFLFFFMHTSYIICILCLPNYWIWPIICCLAIFTDLNPKGDGLLEAALEDEYEWGLVDPEVESEIGVPLPWACAIILFLG